MKELRYIGNKGNYEETIEVRSAEDNETRSIESCAAVYDSWSQIINGWFIECIEYGAHEESIIQDDIRGLFNHDPNLILSRNVANTMSLRTDQNGLHYKMELGNQQYSNDLIESVKRGDISQNSHSFQVLEDVWGTKDIGGIKYQSRTIKKAALFDVGPVTFPAYLDAEGIKTRNLFQESKLDFRALNIVISKIQYGQSPDKSERQLIKDTISYLSGLSERNLEDYDELEVLKYREKFRQI